MLTLMNSKITWETTQKSKVKDVRSFEKRYKGQYNESVMGDYIWNLLRESELTYDRQSRKKYFFLIILNYKFRVL